MSKSSEWTFDFERALATWRQFVSRNPAIRDADLEELEMHLRDAYDNFLADGMDPERAFEAAKDDVGDLALLDSSYGEVHREKHFRPATRRSEIAALHATASNYVKSAWRNAYRQKGISMLNITGMSLALAASLIIGLFIWHSLSFDRFHEQADSILRIEEDRGSWGRVARSPWGLSNLLREEWSGVKEITEVSGMRQSRTQFTVGPVDHLVSDVLEVDSSFFRVFSHTILRSETNNPLEAPNALVLTESTARQWFGTEDPLGEIVHYDAQRDLVITAIVEDPPEATHLPFDVLVRVPVEGRTIRWNSLGGFVYLILEDDTQQDDLISFLDNRKAEDVPGVVAAFSFLPLTDIHLHSEAQDDYRAGGDVQYLLLFGMIGVFILLLAGINYVNMATAQANRRTREIGVRKVIGASGWNLKSQFLLESSMVILLSVPVALLLVVLALPTLRSSTEVMFSSQLLLQPGTWVMILVLALLVSFAAGFYPAVLMARKQPVQVFSGMRTSGTSKQRVRKVLVGVQVGISFGLIVMTLIITAQMRLVSQTNLGFDQDQVVTLSPQQWSMDSFERFRQEVSRHSAIESVAVGLPLGIGWRYSAWKQVLESTGQEVEMELVPIGVRFVDAMQMNVVEGRGFREEDLGLDPAPLLVSESWASTFDDGTPVVGRHVNEYFGPIVGVVRDVQNRSLNTSAPFTLFQLTGDNVPGIVVRLAGSHIPEGLSILADAWDTVSPDRAFDYRFLDEHIQSQYLVEQRLQRFFSWFAGLSIAIAALGILGLAALSARQRDKEIAIRKSLGANVSSILLLLNREFLAIVLAGIVMASPVAWIYGSRWLESFSNRVDMNGTYFLAAGLVCLVFVVVSVTVQSFRAARANPVDALKWD